MNELEKNEEEIAIAEAPKARKPKLSAHFALPQSSVETLIKIIKGYAIASNGGEIQVMYKDVASVTGLNPTIVSRNNSFLAESGILGSQKYGSYAPSEEAVRFAREAAWDEPGAKTHLRKIISETWFGKVATQNFALRSAITKDELRKALAIKCGATEGDTNALNNLIDFIIYTALVETDEKGTLVRGHFDEFEKSSTQTSPIATEPIADANEFPQTQPSVSGQTQSFSTLIHIHIDFKDLTSENAKKIADWLQSVKDSVGSIEIKCDVKENKD